MTPRFMQILIGYLIGQLIAGGWFAMAADRSLWPVAVDFVLLAIAAWLGWLARGEHDEQAA